MTASGGAISVVPANEASWDDLQTIFGTRGEASRCQCQRYKLRPRESFAAFPVEERAHRLRAQTEAVGKRGCCPGWPGACVHGREVHRC